MGEPTSVDETKLIQLVEVKPFLYDISRKDYRNANKRKNGWTSIADELGIDRDKADGGKQ